MHYHRFPPLEASELRFADRKDASNRKGAVELFALDSALCVELRAFAATSRSTLYTMFLMAVTTLLYAYTRRGPAPCRSLHHLRNSSPINRFRLQKA